MNIADLFAKLSVKPDKASFAAGDRLISGIKAALAGVVAFQTVRWAKNLIQQTADTADHFAKLSQRVGVAIEPLQQLAHAADLSGVPLDSLTVALQQLNRQAFEASRGSKESETTFRELGVSLRDARGELRPVDDLLGDVAERFSSLPDGPEKTALAMRAFGRSGAQMIPLLNEGRDGLARLRQEFVEFGGQVSGDTARAFEQFNDDQSRARRQIAGFKTEVAVALLPTLQKLLDRFRAWLRENRALLKQRLLAFVTAIVKVLQILAKVFGVITDVIAFFAENVEILQTILTALAVAFVIVKGEAIAAAIAAAAAWVAALAPFVALVAGIAALILIIQDLWSWFQGGDSVLKDLWNAVKTWVGEKITQVFDDAIAFWRDLFGSFFDWVVESITSIPGKIADAVKDAASSVGDFFGDVGSSVGEFFTGGAPARDVPAPAVRVDAPQVRANINVNTAPGADPRATGVAVRTAIDEWWSSKMRATAGAVR